MEYPSSENQDKEKRKEREAPICDEGIIIEKSRCCGAPLKATEGGITMYICTKCGKGNPPPTVFKRNKKGVH